MPATSLRHPACDLAPFDLPLYDRWVIAAQIAHRLAPAAWERGGFASAEVRVAVPGHPPQRPAAAVVLGSAPVDPVVTVPPLLVIELSPACAPATWLARGVKAVWSVGREGAWCSAGAAPPRFVAAPGLLRLPVRRSSSRVPPLELALPVVAAAP